RRRRRRRVMTSPPELSLRRLTRARPRGGRASVIPKAMASPSSASVASTTVLTSLLRRPVRRATCVMSWRFCRTFAVSGSAGPTFSDRFFDLAISELLSPGVSVEKKPREETPRGSVLLMGDCRAATALIASGGKPTGLGGFFGSFIPFDGLRHPHQRMLQHFAHMADRDDLQSFLHIGRNLGQVFFVICRDKHHLDTTPQCRQQLFLKPTDGQHIAAQ